MAKIIAAMPRGSLVKACSSTLLLLAFALVPAAVTVEGSGRPEYYSGKPCVSGSPDYMATCQTHSECDRLKGFYQCDVVNCDTGLISVIEHYCGRGTAMSCCIRIRPKTAAPTPVKRTPAPTKAAKASIERTMSIKLRIFIPTQLVKVVSDGWLPPAFKPLARARAVFHNGNNRGFRASGGTSKVDVEVKAVYKDSKFIKARTTRGAFGPSYEFYDWKWPLHTQVTSGVKKLFLRKDQCTLRDVDRVHTPMWGCWRLKRGASPVRKKQLVRGKNDFIKIAPFIPSKDKGELLLVRFVIKAGNPLVPRAPKIDANITISLRISKGTYKIAGQSRKNVIPNAYGKHDGFPAYEIYANDRPLYRFDPRVGNHSPLDLLGEPEVNVKLQKSSSIPILV